MKWFINTVVTGLIVLLIHIVSQSYISGFVDNVKHPGGEPVLTLVESDLVIRV